MMSVIYMISLLAFSRTRIRVMSKIFLKTLMPDVHYIHDYCDVFGDCNVYAVRVMSMTSAPSLISLIAEKLVICVPSVMSFTFSYVDFTSGVFCLSAR